MPFMRPCVGRRCWRGRCFWRWSACFLFSSSFSVLELVFSPRAAWLHIGALIGTLMAGNVAMVIIPTQKTHGRRR